VTDDPVVEDDGFEDLLLFLRESRGVDFTGYKRNSLRRLVSRRMTTAGYADARSYLDALEADPGEVRTLFDSLLINVTALFRDTGMWDALRDTHLPALLERLGPDDPVRVWSAACATGEEAYSLAVLLHEQLGAEAFARRVKVYATDVDEPALAVARAGRYPEAALEPLSEAQRERYLEQQDGGWCFRSELRQAIIFGRHDLLADAPISRVSLLLCRNALMYFTAETQARILERFAFALRDGGLLVLGRAEMLLTHTDLYAAVDLPHRVFRGTRRPTSPRSFGFGPAALARQAATRQVTEAAFLSAPDPQLVLDSDGRVALVNESARRELGALKEHVGRPFTELQLSITPVDVRAEVSALLAGGGATEVRGVLARSPGGRDRWWDVQLLPLRGGDEPLGATIAWVEVTRYHELTDQLARAHGELQEAYEELQSSSEELETTNEELQSAIEELETTNEELQSTNEELETMNEELQSTNEELQTVNDELRDRTGEVREVNAFLESVLSGLRTAVTVVDRDLRVLVWNARCEQLWGVRPYEAEGRPLSDLDGGAPVERLSTLARAVLVDETTTPPESVVAVNRLGQSILVTTGASPLRDRSGAVRGAILTMEETALGADGS
jgi:two-component system, chemotaxis family, CheB/CheR fusion protein